MESCAVKMNSCIHKCRKECLKETKTYFPKFLLVFCICQLYQSFGSLMFFYVEECYAVVPKELNVAEKTLLEICKSIKHINNTTANVSHIQSLCNITSEMLQHHYKCELTLETFCTWYKFTCTVVFTIGYGNIVPRSDMGKIVYMFYALPGIAIAVTAYVYLARAITALTKYGITSIQLKVFNYALVCKRTNATTLILQIIMAIATLFTLAGFHTFDELENYRFLNSFYFAFSTITTIGFGDFSFKFEKYVTKPHFLFAVCFVFFLGLGLVASIVTGLSEFFSGKSMWCCKSRSLKKKEESDNNNNDTTNNNIDKDKNNREMLYKYNDVFKSYANIDQYQSMY